MSNDTTATYELTNTCTCSTYNEETDTWEESGDCLMDCWDDNVSDFYNVNETFLNSNDTGWWKVTDLGLWHGDVSGYFYVKPSARAWKDTERIVEGMTVNSEWTMRYTPYPDRIEYSLSHHDSMGSNTTITALTEEEVEALGFC